MHALVRHLVAVRRAAEVLGGDLLQLLLEVHRRGVDRARRRVRGHRPGLDAGPGQSLRGVAPDQLHFLPGEVEHFRRGARGVGEGVGAQVADAGVDLELAVGSHHHEAVEAERARRVARERDADAGDLGSLLLARQLLDVVPVDQRFRLVDRLADERAGEAALVAVELRRRVGRVDAAQLEPVDAQLLGGGVDQGLEHRRDLRAARARAARSAAACW